MKQTINSYPPQRKHTVGRLVDTVEVGIMPVLLGGGIPLLPPQTKETKLKLTSHKVYAKTGIVSLGYAVQYTRPDKRLKRTRK